MLGLLLRGWCGVVQPSVAVQERQAEPVINLSGAMSTMGALSTSSVLASFDEDEMTPEAKQCVQALREGKRCAHMLPWVMANAKIMLVPSLSYPCLVRCSYDPACSLCARVCLMVRFADLTLESGAQRSALWKHRRVAPSHVPISAQQELCWKLRVLVRNG